MKAPIQHTYTILILILILYKYYYSHTYTHHYTQVSNFNPNLECFVQVIKEEDRDILKDSDVDVVICLDEFKTILQARNAICPGFSTLIGMFMM